MQATNLSINSAVKAMPPSQDLILWLKKERDWNILLQSIESIPRILAKKYFRHFGYSSCCENAISECRSILWENAQTKWIDDFIERCNSTVKKVKSLYLFLYDKLRDKIRTMARKGQPNITYQETISDKQQIGLESSDPYTDLERKERIEEIRARFDTLPPKVQQAIKLKQKNFSHEEIGKFLRVSKRQVCRWLKIARNTIMPLTIIVFILYGIGNFYVRKHGLGYLALDLQPSTLEVSHTKPYDLGVTFSIPNKNAEVNGSRKVDGHDPTFKLSALLNEGGYHGKPCFRTSKLPNEERKIRNAQECRHGGDRCSQGNALQWHSGAERSDDRITWLVYRRRSGLRVPIVYGPRHRTESRLGTASVDRRYLSLWQRPASIVFGEAGPSELSVWELRRKISDKSAGQPSVLQSHIPSNVHVLEALGQILIENNPTRVSELRQQIAIPNLIRDTEKDTSSIVISGDIGYTAWPDGTDDVWFVDDTSISAGGMMDCTELVNIALNLGGVGYSNSKTTPDSEWNGDILHFDIGDDNLFDCATPHRNVENRMKGVDIYGGPTSNVCASSCAEHYLISLLDSPSAID